MASDQIQTAETVAIEKFVVPSANQITLISGDAGHIEIRSDVAYARAGTALQTVRSKRKGLAAYFKEQPNGDPGPGQGLCYFARRAWESAQSLFNRFDQQFKQWDETIDGGMKKYRAEVEEKARAEAEAKATEERKRLEAEAAKVRGPERQRILEEVKAVIPVIERGAPQAAGVSVRKVWKAEVLDIGKLVKAIADGKAPLVCVEPNESQCNKLAAAFGGQNPPPGLRFYQDEQTSARKVK
jgi:F0F1-type ATP synthase membrane subunit b/b'